jgi:ketosteroid isomerase-like protein
MRTIAFLLVLGTAGLQAQSAATAIPKANAEFIRLFNAGDAVGVAKCYTPDAEVLAPNAEAVSGQAAIEGLWKTLVGAGFKDLTLEVVRIEQSVNMAYERGRYTMTTPQGKDHGKYVVVWKRLPKTGWHLHIDSFSSDLPAPK